MSGARAAARAPLRVGAVGIRRAPFKGDAEAIWRRSRAGLERLADAWAFDLVAAETLVGDGAEAAAEAERVRELELDLLLVQLTTFATGEVVAPFAAAARAVGLWGLPESAAGTGEGPLPLNSLCGLTMAMSMVDGPELTPRGPVKWFYGEAHDPAFERRLAVTLGALRGLRALEGARVLAVGGVAPGFYRLGREADPGVAGVTVVRRELAELLERVARVPQARAEALARRYREREATDLSDAQLARGARVELALGALAEEARADALAVRCWPEVPEACGAMACAALGNHGEREVPAACEGDVMGAVSMLALQGVSGASAILMDLSDVDAAGERLQLWHCGNAPAAWAAGGAAGSRLTTHFNRDGVGPVRDMRLAPGEVTGFRLLAGGSRAVVAGGTIEALDAPAFDGVSGWVGRLAWAGEPVSASGFVANLLDRGLPHHLAFGRGDHTDALTELCARLGAEILPRLPARPYLRAAAGA